jgi:hypothetical protein
MLGCKRENLVHLSALLQGPENILLYSCAGGAGNRSYLFRLHRPRDLVSDFASVYHIRTIRR